MGAGEGGPCTISGFFVAPFSKKRVPPCPPSGALFAHANKRSDLAIRPRICPSQNASPSKGSCETLTSSVNAEAAILPCVFEKGLKNLDPGAVTAIAPTVFGFSATRTNFGLSCQEPMKSLSRARQLVPHHMLRGTVCLTGLLALVPFVQAQTTRIPLTMVVGSTGHMRNDSKGPYVTGVDYVGVWLEPSRWPRMSFDFCMNWPFTIPVRPKRTVEHDLTDPVPHGGGIPMGVFTSPSGNDLVISRPLNAAVKTFADIPVGSSISPDSAEVRICNSDCSEYYVLIFGKESVWYPEEKLSAAGTTKPVVTRTSAESWSIFFPPRSIGRLWKRSGVRADLGLYYYDGRIEVELQKSPVPPPDAPRPARRIE